MAVEVRARRIVITDVRDAVVLRRYVKDEQSSLLKPTRDMWKKQAAFINPDTVKLSIRIGMVPNKWLDPWAKITREYVRDDMTAAWLKGLTAGGDRIASKINRLQRKQFDFDSTMIAIKAWLDKHAADLIKDLSGAQMSSVHALLMDQIALGVTSPYVLAQRLKPIVGLTNKEANAISKLIANLTEEGIAPARINKLVEDQAKRLHRNRASRIAQTEISNAYNAGQFNSIQQAVDAGELPGIPTKEWLAGGPNPCDDCSDNEAAGPIAMDEIFPSDHMVPTAHPSCACAISYSVRS